MEIKKINLDQEEEKVIPTDKAPSRVSSGNNLLPTIIGIVVFALLGTGTGYLIKNLAKPGSSTLGGSTVQPSAPPGGAVVGQIYGSANESDFKDSATGVLEKGGINGEGTHQLLRSGGASQTVYLTSSVLDLDEFVGSKVTVWGETFSSAKAGWLMDVGKIKVVE